MTNELTTTKARSKSPMALIPTTMAEVGKLAETIHNSQLAPYGIDTPQKIFVAICHGLEVGLPPMAALQSIAVIGGRPSMWGDALLGLVTASDLLEDMEETFDDETMTATCTMKRVGRATPIARSFSQADAELAGLWGKRGQSGKPSPWVTYPKRMLQHRARGLAIKDGFPDVIKGLAVREEQEDIVRLNPPDKQEEKQSRLAQLQENVGGAAGEGFDADMIEAELQGLEAPVEDDITEPEKTPESAPDAQADAIPDVIKMIKDVHMGLYELKTAKAINTFYKNNFLEIVASLDDIDRNTVESIMLKHLERVDGTVTPEDVAKHVKGCLTEAKQADRERKSHD